MNLNLFGRDIFIKKSVAITGAILLILLVSITGYFINKNNNSISIKTDNELLGTETPNVNSSTPVATPTENVEEIKVYVTGCVKKPGIVTLKKGQLIDDAIKAAGGATANADLESINLVYELQENVMLQIKSKNESQSNPGQKGGVLSSSKGSQQNNSTDEVGKGAKIIKDSGGAVVNNGGSNTTGTGKININTASVEELDKLPGVGPKIAADIVAYRT